MGLGTVGLGVSSAWGCSLGCICLSQAGDAVGGSRRGAQRARSDGWWGHRLSLHVCGPLGCVHVGAGGSEGISCCFGSGGTHPGGWGQWHCPGTHAASGKRAVRTLREPVPLARRLKGVHVGALTFQGVLLPHWVHSLTQKGWFPWQARGTRPTDPNEHPGGDNWPDPGFPSFQLPPVCVSLARGGGGDSLGPIGGLGAFPLCGGGMERQEQHARSIQQPSSMTSPVVCPFGREKPVTPPIREARDPPCHACTVHTCLVPAGGVAPTPCPLPGTQQGRGDARKLPRTAPPPPPSVPQQPPLSLGIARVPNARH